MIDAKSWVVPPVFEWLEQQGTVDHMEMFNTFNMGVGFVAIAPPSHAKTAINQLAQQGIHAWAIGEIIPRKGNALVFSS